MNRGESFRKTINSYLILFLLFYSFLALFSFRPNKCFLYVGSLQTSYGPLAFFPENSYVAKISDISCSFAE